MPQEVGTPTNIITGLPGAMWRGLVDPPYDAANVSGGFDLSRGKFPFVNGYSHDNMGATETEFPFRFYFLNSLGEDLFPGLFREWSQAVILDGTPDKLLHPIFGEFDARVTKWDVELQAQRTAGVIFNVTWVNTILDPDEPQKFEGVPVNLQEVAAQADEDLNNLEIDFPTGETTTSLTDMIGQINGLAFSFKNRIDGIVNKALGLVESIIETVEALETHRKWAAEANLKALHRGMTLLKDASKRQPLRPTKLFFTPRPMSLDEIAGEVGNSLEDMVALNAALLSAPAVPLGTPVNYFTE